MVLFLKNNSVPSTIVTEIQRIDVDKVKEKLDATNFYEKLDHCDSPCNAFSELLKLVHDNVDDSKYSIKMRHKESEDVPKWIDQKYARMINHRQNIADKISKLKKMNKNVSNLLIKSAELDTAISEYSNKKAKNYYKKLISHNTSLSWNLINDITGRGKKSKNWLCEINGQLTNNKQQIVDALSNKFADVIGQVKSIVPIFHGEATPNSFVLQLVDEECVQQLLLSIEVKKATGSDDIPAKIWKNSAISFAPIITDLVNNCFMSSEYPSELKIAKIIAIPKGLKTTAIDNYRGISLLPVINKIFEKILHNQLQSFLTKYKLVDEHQYGFIRNRGTQEAVANFVHVVSKFINQKKSIVVVFLDVAKAFDSINHDVLLYKLEKVGIRGNALALMNSYLKNRCQFVQIDGECSKRTQVERGVPQGTNIGPLLFNLMLYDMKNLDVESMIFKYADDTVLISSCKNDEDISLVIGKDLQKLVSYYHQNGLDLNLSKSLYMSFNVTSHETLDKFMENANIKKSQVVRYLGVQIDNKLRMTNYAEELIGKISQSIHALSIIKCHLPTQQMLQYYHAFIGSHLYYCSFLMSRLNAGQIQRLQVMQNRSLKIVFGLHHRTPTLDVFTKYAPKILPVTGIFYLSHLMLLKKSILAQDNSMPKIDVITEGRRAGSLKIERFKCKIYERDFVCFGTSIYNQLPTNIKEITKIHQFKGACKDWLLSKTDELLNPRQLVPHKLI
jgi:hypothetical protein